MLLDSRIVQVPALAEIEDKPDDGDGLRNEVRAGFGAAAVEVGSVDSCSVEEDATDAVANILHHVAEDGISDPWSVLRMAGIHYAEEAGACIEPLPGSFRLSAEAVRVLGHLLSDETHEQVTASDATWHELRTTFPARGPLAMPGDD